jgi:pilus assembly protein Flp/PilA
MKDLLYRLVVEEDGPTAVEYAVILALLVATCISSVNLLANNTAASFDDSASQINSALGGS